MLKFRIFCYPTLRFEENLSKRMHQINATPGIQHSGTPTNQKEVHTVHTTSLPASCNPEHRTHGDTGTSQQTLWVQPPPEQQSKAPRHRCPPYPTFCKAVQKVANEWLKRGKDKVRGSINFCQRKKKTGGSSWGQKKMELLCKIIIWTSLSS